MELNRFSLPVAAAIMMINASLLVQGCLEEERLALLHIKTSMFDPNHMGSPLLHSWGNDALCCSWTGVHCDPITGRVNEIVLFNVRGWFIDPSRADWRRDASIGDWYLNATLFLPFQELKTLGLRNNYMAGCVANEGFERLSRLNKLESLDLGLNNFNNSILSSLKGLSSLKHLYLDGNLLKGSIDTKEFDSLSKLVELRLEENEIQNFATSTGFERSLGLNKLEILDLSSNRISDGNLSFLKGLSSLKQLHLNKNQLKGSMEMKEFDSLSKLVELRLEENKIQNFATSTGSERSLGLNKLEILGLSFNKFNDSSLSFLEGLSSLKQLNLDNNQLKGSMDMKGLCELKQLQELDISHNDLNGLPSCLANLTNLQVLDISSNEFTGNISLSPIGSLTSIRDLNLSDNRFQIPISLCPLFNLSNLKNLIGDNNEIYESTELEHNLIPRFQLQRLSLACNGFGGTFPRFLYYQQDLLHVDLSYIKMTGEFPSWLLQNNTKLKKLYLVSNSLSGSFKLPNRSHVSLSRLDISRNEIDSQIPTEIGSCFPRLLFLNLSRNHFGGSIPSSISNMSVLDIIDLSNNRLTGPIPSTFSNLKDIESLDLSYNNLNGEIPRQLIDLHNLAVFTVAHNNLSGKMPERAGQFGTFDSSSYEGNLLLCGVPLDKNCTGGTRNKEENGFMGAFMVTFSVAYIMFLLAIGSVLYINPWWRRAWFHFIGESINNCYYFLVDNLPVPARFRRFQSCV